MDGSTFTRARYPDIIPHDLAAATPATAQTPRTTLSFAELAAQEQRARWARDGRSRWPTAGTGQLAPQETLDEWVAALATLPGPFIAQDATNAMGCQKSATHNRLHMLAHKGLVRKSPGRTHPQLWEVVKKMRGDVK